MKVLAPSTLPASSM